MTEYNVVEDRAEWARVKASLMTAEDRHLLMGELIRRDEMGAVIIIAELAAKRHGERRRAREASKAEPENVSTT